MEYKVGDKVRIKSIDWYNENKNKYGNIKCGYMPFTSDMSIYCGEVLTICDIKEEFSYYHMKKCKYQFTDEMIEGLVEEPLYKATVDKNGNMTGEFVRLKEANTLKTQSDNMETETHRGYYTTVPETTSEGKKRGVVYFWDNDFADKVELDLSDRELIQEDGKWFVVKKKKEYPKTYEECCRIVNANPYIRLVYNLSDGQKYSYDEDNLWLYESIRKLLICRDAYWKLYGEEMGLGKPWEPTMETVYCISRNNNVMKCSYRGGKSNILEFPTEEMRDAFYEAFKELVEERKELL